MGAPATTLCRVTRHRSLHKHRHLRSAAASTIAALISLTVACQKPGGTSESTARAITTASGAITATADDLRSGWYPDQPRLDPAIVGGPTFGRLFKTTLPLNPGEAVFAQPLVSGTNVFVATEANDIYALDTETGAITAQRALGQAWRASDIGCTDLVPTIGITGTPVIDTNTNTAYFFSKGYKPGTNGPGRADAAYYVHAVDVATLAERPNFPVLVAGTASNDPTLTFQAYGQLQRPALLLMDGVVYAAFGGHCDYDDYHGWIVGVGTDGTIRTLFATEAGPQKVKGAGIWQSGGGIVSDGPGRIFFSTGNGYSNSIVNPTPGNTPPPALDQSVVRIERQADGSFAAKDFFTPYDVRFLDDADLDLGSGGPIGLPSPTFGTAAHPHLMVAGGKQGILYLLDRDNLGGFQQGPSGGDAVVSRTNSDGGMWSRPAVWPGDGGWVYVTSAGWPIDAFRYGVRADGVPALTLTGRGSDLFYVQGGSPIVTSDGTTSGTALVWAIYVNGSNSALRAYDAVPNASGTLVSRFEDTFGAGAKFSVPGIGAGRVYVGSGEGTVIGYGAPKTTPLSGSVTDFGTVTVGGSSQLTVTLTATQTTTVTRLDSTDAAFALGTPSVALPATLTSGQSFTVPVTFSPTTVKSYAASLEATAAEGTSAVALKGAGQAAGAKLTVTPGSVSFGGLNVGTTATSNITVSNTGSAPLSFGTVTLPTAPFSAQGAPTSGQTLAPGDSFIISVTFAPTDAGTYSSNLALASDGGTATLYLSGNGAYAGSLAITPLALDFGAVTIGNQVSRSFTIRNTGGTNLTVTKSKPPALGPFQPTTTLSEGTLIEAGATFTETVSFTPTATGTFTDSWSIAGSDGQGLQTVTFTGYGGAGTGLAATYYDNQDFTGATVKRTDPTVNFSWGAGSPDPAIASDTFSARWLGQVQAAYTETYTFYATADDGVRVWVNGNLIIDQGTQPGVEGFGTVALTAGQSYPIKVEYLQSTGTASVSLSWSSASTAKQIVPTANLFPASEASDTVCGTANENQALTLSCPAGETIASVTYASYGNGTGSCGSFTTGACNATTSSTVLSSACVGKATCTVQADNVTFGDPCAGILKTLHVQVACSGSTVATTTGGGASSDVCGTAGENASTTLTCPAGQTIKSVAFASYGTPTGSCGAFTTSSCNVASSSTIVSSACVGKAACTISADNVTFGGDPCPNVVKQVAAQVTCGL